MTIQKINLVYPNTIPSTYDNESVTALELAALTSKKVDECIDMVNGVEQSAIEAEAVVDDMKMAQDQFMRENNDIRQQLVIDNQSYVDTLTESKTTFERNMTADLTKFKSDLDTDKTNYETGLNTSKTTFETNMNADLTKFKSDLNTDKTNYETGLNASKTTFETNMTNAVNNVVTNSETIIQDDVNTKVNALINNGTIESLINDTIIGGTNNRITDTEMSINESTGFGIINGLTVLAQSSPDMSLLISTGTAHLYNGKRFTLLANATKILDPSDPLYDRIDIIYINSDGVLTYGKGQAATQPIAPTPVNGLTLAQIYITKAVTKISSANITDTRQIKSSIPDIINKFTSNIDDNGTNIKTMGAIEGTDSTKAVQDSINIGNTVLVTKGAFPITALTNLLGVDFNGVGDILLPKNLKANSKYAKPKESIIFGIEYLAAFHKKCMTLAPPNFLTATNKLKVYLSGDSTTTGVGLTDTNYKLDVLLETLAVKSGMSFVDFVDKGHSGYLTSEWVTEFLTGEIGDNPDLFVLRWGINDGKYGYVNDGVFNKTLAERVNNFITNMRTALTRIRAKSVNDLSIIIMTPNSTSDYYGGRDEQWFEAIIPAIKQMARDFQCCFINTYQIAQDSRNASAYMDSPYSDDRHVHPLEVMNLWITSAMFETIFPIALRNKIADNLLLNEHTKNTIKTLADAPNKYNFGVNLSRFQDTGYDGAVYTMRQNSGIAFQIYTNYNPAAMVVKYRLAADGDSWGAFTTLGQDMTNIFANVAGATLIKQATDAPNTYPKGVSMYRATTGFPNDGIAISFYHADDILLQFNIPYSLSEFKLSARIGSGTSWSPWGTIV